MVSGIAVIENERIKMPLMAAGKGPGTVISARFPSARHPANFADHDGGVKGGRIHRPEALLTKLWRL